MATIDHGVLTQFYVAVELMRNNKTLCYTKWARINELMSTLRQQPMGALYTAH